MRILLHICCANCAIYPVEMLREEGHDVTGLFFNPNIHPYAEFVRRREALEKLAEEMQLRVIFLNSYPLEEFFRKVAFREAQRCRLCYQWRLETTSRVARRGKFQAFSTTLLFSKHQAHDLIREVGQAEALGSSTDFLYRDFRVGWKQANVRSKEMGLYRQTYCGCLYSQAETQRVPRSGILRRPKSPTVE